MRTILPPENYTKQSGEVSLFLGGSIELGKAELWQDKLIAELATRSYADKLVIYNPRREGWHASTPLNNPDHPGFREQVEWELKCQDSADCLLYYFAAETMSPITLLELGIYSARRPVIHTTPDYLRHANVVITAEHLGLPVQTSWDDFVSAVDMDIQRVLKIQIAA